MDLSRSVFFIFLFVIVVSFCSCAQFSIVLPDGTNLKETGAPLLNRQGEFVIRHEWLDKENVLHEIRINRNTEENTDAQYRALDRLAGIIESFILSERNAPE